MVYMVLNQITIFIANHFIKMKIESIPSICLVKLTDPLHKIWKFHLQLVIKQEPKNIMEGKWVIINSISCLVWFFVFKRCVNCKIGPHGIPKICSLSLFFFSFAWSVPKLKISCRFGTCHIPKNANLAPMISKNCSLISVF